MKKPCTRHNDVLWFIQSSHRPNCDALTKTLVGFSLTRFDFSPAPRKTLPKPYGCNEQVVEIRTPPVSVLHRRGEIRGGIGFFEISQMKFIIFYPMTILVANFSYQSPSILWKSQSISTYKGISQRVSPNVSVRKYDLRKETKSFMYVILKLLTSLYWLQGHFQSFNSKRTRQVFMEKFINVHV